MKSRYIAALFAGSFIPMWAGSVSAPTPAVPETTDDEDFDSFMKGAIDDFNAFLDEENKAFLEFMSKPWKGMNTLPPLENPMQPEPKVQPEAKPQAKPDAPKQLPVKEVVKETSKKKPTKKKPVEIPKINPDKPTPAPKPEIKPEVKPAVKPEIKPEVKPEIKPEPKPEVKPESKPEVKPEPKPEVKPEPVPEVKPEPVVKTPETKVPNGSPLYTGGAGRVPMEFAGVTYYVDGALKGNVHLMAVNEPSIAAAYQELLTGNSKQLLSDLKTLRKDGLNSDWALYLFIEDLTKEFASGNDAVLLRQFLLNQLGYKARLGIKGTDELMLLLAPETEIYGKSMVMLDGQRYFVLDSKAPGWMRICMKEAPRASGTLDMRLEGLPRLGGAERTSTHTGIGKASAVSATVSVPENLVKFYDRIPQIGYGLYSSSAVLPSVADALKKQIAPAIAGKSEKEAAGILLDYIQKGFKYATDEEQFGHEKPFFIEECYYWPMCDCEDRAVFYRYLVREFLGLDVVLLKYPNHLASAVKFTEPIQGDYVTVNGEKYWVCDPTFIGAGIGRAMPNCRDIETKIIIP